MLSSLGGQDQGVDRHGVLGKIPFTPDMGKEHGCFDSPGLRSLLSSWKPGSLCILRSTRHACGLLLSVESRTVVLVYSLSFTCIPGLEDRDTGSGPSLGWKCACYGSRESLLLHFTQGAPTSLPAKKCKHVKTGNPTV